LPLLQRKAAQYVLAFAAMQFLFTVAGQPLSDRGDKSPLILAFAAGNWALFLWNWGVYIRDLGVSYERRDAVIGLAAVVAVTLFGAVLWFRFASGG
jgi:hypothetical protein